jgi:hypothetical protein
LVVDVSTRLLQTTTHITRREGGRGTRFSKELFGLQTQRSLDTGREALKWVAVATMTIDHIGAVLFPQYDFLRVIGRLSFPLYCYLIVLGVDSTRQIRNYFLRLFFFACVSQVPFYLALERSPFGSLNIFFTLAFGVLSTVNPVLMIASLGLSYFMNFDYGPYGIALIAAMRILKDHTRNGLIVVVLLNTIIAFESPIQPFSLLAVPLILLYKNGLPRVRQEGLDEGYRDQNTYPSWRKYFFYVYYPLHLTIIYAVKSLILTHSYL